MLIALEKVPIFNHIKDNIFLGDIVAANNLELLSKNKMQVVISMISSSSFSQASYEYYEFPIEDNRNENIYVYFEPINKLIDKISKEKNILIYCHNAVSRSVTITLAYLMYTGISLKESFDLIKNRETFSRPNYGFFKQLLKYENELFGKNSMKLKDIF